MKVWLALDPETRRVFMQDREPGDGDFPRGTRGLSWPIRTGDVDDDVWTGLLAGRLSPDDQDQLHRQLWTDNGEAAWPDA